MYREAEPVDAYIEDVVVARVTQPDAAEAFRANPAAGPDIAAIRAEIEALHARMGKLAEAFADGTLTDNALRAGTERAKSRIAELEASIPQRHTAPALVSLVTARDARVAWRALTVEDQRTVVRCLLRVQLAAPGTKENASLVVDGRKVANPATVKVEWV